MEYTRQIEACLFAKLMALNCVNFDFDGSSFSEKNVRVKDKREGLSKEGSGRVALFKASNLPRCYTLECNYHSGKVINDIPITPLDNDEQDQFSSPLYENGPPPYDIGIFENIGKGICVTMLDMIDRNPYSRLQASDHNDLNGMRLSVAKTIASWAPFRFDPVIKKAAKKEEDLANYLTTGGKIVKTPNPPPKPKPRRIIKKEKEERKIAYRRPPKPDESTKSSNNSDRVSSSSYPTSATSASSRPTSDVMRLKEVAVVPIRHYVFPKPMMDEGTLPKLPEIKRKVRGVKPQASFKRKNSKSLCMKKVFEQTVSRGQRTSLV